MFKPVKMMDEIVPHRMGGNHAQRDPLLDDKMGSMKRSRAGDGSDMQIYRETPEERKSRIKSDRKSDKMARKAEKHGMTEEEVLKKLRMDDEGEAARHNSAGVMAPRAPVAVPAAPHEAASARGGKTKVEIGSFKDRLKSSGMADQAAAAEKKHKAEETAKNEELISKAREVGASSSKKSDEGDEVDKKVTFSEIWKEGDEESEKDWLGGGGLKFHTTADKAFSMDSGRFKEACASKVSAENREAAADEAKKRGEIRMANFRHGKKG